MVREAICPCLLKSSKYLQYPYIYMDYFVIKNTCNVALISTMEFDICDLRKLSVAQTTVEGMDNKLSN